MQYLLPNIATKVNKTKGFLSYSDSYILDWDKSFDQPLSCTIHHWLHAPTSILDYYVLVRGLNFFCTELNACFVLAVI